MSFLQDIVRKIQDKLSVVDDVKCFINAGTSYGAIQILTETKSYNKRREILRKAQWNCVYEIARKTYPEVEVEIVTDRGNYERKKRVSVIINRERMLIPSDPETGEYDLGDITKRMFSPQQYETLKNIEKWLENNPD